MIINSGSRAIGGYATGDALMVAAKVDNKMTFKGHPDLIKKANMLDETAYALGVVSSLSAMSASVGSGGTATPVAYGVSLGANISFGLYLEYEKLQLLKKKEQREKGGKPN